MKPDAKMAARLRDLREARGLTQEQLAEKAGVSRGYLARLETARQDPSLSTLTKLARALRVSIADLLRREVRTGDSAVAYLGDNPRDPEATFHLERGDRVTLESDPGTSGVVVDGLCRFTRGGTGPYEDRYKIRLGDGREIWARSVELKPLRR